MEPNSPAPPPPYVPPLPPSAPPLYVPTQYTPQQYTPPPPPKGRSPLFYAAIIGGCCGVPVLLLSILASVLFPVFAQAREKARFTACLSNVKTMTLATVQYAQDWDEKYPPAKRWMTNLEPYVKPTASEPSGMRRSNLRLPVNYFHCPVVAPRHTDSDKYGYAFNSLLNFKSLQSLDSSGQTPMIYDSENTQKNASDPFKSVAYRHGKRKAVIGYADGHCLSVSAPDAQDDSN